MRTAIVPVNSGVLSAFGMLAAPRSRELSRSLLGELSQMPISDIEHGFTTMLEEGQVQLLAEGVAIEKIQTKYWLDLRYLGQSYTLPVSWENKRSAIDAFHQLHKSRYGHDLDLAVELVNLRLSLSADMPKPALTKLSARSLKRALNVSSEGNLAIYQRQDLLPDDVIEGEALIVEQVATTYLAPGWSCKVDEYSNLVLTKNTK